MLHDLVGISGEVHLISGRISMVPFSVFKFMIKKNVVELQFNTTMFDFWCIDLSLIQGAQMQNWIYWIRPKVCVSCLSKYMVKMLNRD